MAHFPIMKSAPLATAPILSAHPGSLSARFVRAPVISSESKPSPRRRRRSDEVPAHIDAVHRGVGRSRCDLREWRVTPLVQRPEPAASDIPPDSAPAPFQIPGVPSASPLPVIRPAKPRGKGGAGPFRRRRIKWLILEYCASGPTRLIDLTKEIARGTLYRHVDVLLKEGALKQGRHDHLPIRAEGRRVHEIFMAGEGGERFAGGHVPEPASLRPASNLVFPCKSTSSVPADEFQMETPEIDRFLL